MDPGTSFLCMFVLTREYGKVSTAHVSHKSRRPKLTSYLGNLALNRIVNKMKELTDKGKDHKEPQSNLGWKGALEEPNTGSPKHPVFGGSSS